jgi:predicted enzyme related to lactoylglutathione lyase
MIPAASRSPSQRKEPKMADRKQLPGKFVWFELVSKDAKKAQAFYGEVLGWKVQQFPMGSSTYDMIYAGDTMIGGYAHPKSDRQPSHWISYVSVDDVDATVKAATANGGKVVEAPYDIPTVGRTARIADPQGAELCPFKSLEGDPADALPPPGGFCWNELHTSDPAKALTFYEKVLGFSHRTVSGPGFTYHILSRGGVDRGGVTDNEGQPPHWLPYVAVDDADSTLARAKKLGGTLCIGPADIPNVGRFGVLQDPTGAALAVLKPLPTQK